LIINLKNGIDKILFGMKQKDVESVLGKPNKKFNDEDRNVIYLYYDKKLRLTFYADEDLKLGYIISSNPKITLLNSLIIGKDIDYLKSELPFKSWEIEDFDSVENHFNESNWLILQTEYNEVIRVEIGAIIKDNDEFDWKFK
jgi:hypothetical protein